MVDGARRPRLRREMEDTLAFYWKSSEYFLQHTAGASIEWVLFCHLKITNVQETQHVRQDYRTKREIPSYQRPCNRHIVSINKGMWWVLTWTGAHGTAAKQVTALIKLFSSNSEVTAYLSFFTCWCKWLFRWNKYHNKNCVQENCEKKEVF